MDESYLSYLGQRWHKRSEDGDVDALIAAGCTPLVARILVGRGIATVEEAKAFLDCGLHRLHDPRSLKGVDEAVDRIVQALDAGEMIGIYGDYDVDGQTSAALLARVLKALGAEVATYIPHRTKEGYGLNIPALEELRAKGCTLVITVDCGISAIQEAEWARSNDLDLIITDHHQPHDDTPHAVSIINPQLDLDYPCPYLAGCGVAFKLAEALSEAKTGDRGLAHRWIELVAIGTVADVVPLVGENRALVRVGLEKLNSGGAIPGLQALRAVAGVHTEVTAGQVGFVLAPRLNAVGRVGDPSIGLKLLLAESYDEALPLARKLEAENDARRQLEEEVAEEARRVADELFDPEEDYGLVVHGRGWHPGVIGIVASRLAESYYRPTVILSVEGNEARGSARSIPGFDLYQALAACSEHFTAFGGHQAAAGLTLPADEIEAFRESFRQVTRSMLSPDDLIPRLQYEAEVEIAEITTDWVEAIKELEPFGMGNPAPVLVIRNCEIQASAVGKDKTHLRLWVADRDNHRRVDGIGFGIARQLLPQLGPKATVDIAFVPDINEWNGRRSPQLRLRDIREASPAAMPERGFLAAIEETAAADDTRGVSVEVPPIAIQNGRHGADIPILSDVAGALRSLDVNDMRGVPPVRIFETLEQQGRVALVVPALPDLAPGLVREIASLSSALKERIALCGKGEGREHKQRLRRVIEAPGAILVASHLDGLNPEEHQLTELLSGRKGAILLWHVPAHPREGLLHLYGWRALLPDALFVLATESERDRQAAKEVQLSFPDRDALGRIYVALRDALRQSAVLGWGEVAAAVQARWPGIATRRGVWEAVAIFDELGLVQVRHQGVTLVQNTGKVDLAKSLRYNEGIAIRSEYPRFADELRETAAQSVIELLIERGTPWWQQLTSDP